MTALLLDSHVFAWATDRPDRLSLAARAALSDPANTLVVSAASAWEVTTKYRLGRWPEAERLATQFAETAEALGAALLPITVHHATRAGSLEWNHTDPFDRMLAAQAFLEDLTLVSVDRAFAKLQGLKLIR